MWDFPIIKPCKLYQLIIGKKYDTLCTTYLLMFPTILMMVNVVVVVVVYSNSVVVDVGPRNTGSTWKLKAIMKLSI